MMPGFSRSDVILITGGNGHVASHIVQQLLAINDGPKVRATVRSQSSIDALKSVFSKYVDGGRLSVYQVSDITKASAFDTLIEDVTHVAHVASPIYVGTDDLDRNLIQPAVRGTTGILTAAAQQKSASLKSIVITGSIAAVLDPNLGWPQKGKVYTSKDWDPVTEDLVYRAAAATSKGEVLGSLGAFTPEVPYYYSKTAAEKAAWDFYEQHRKSKGIKWGLSTILPVRIGGPSVIPPKRMPDGSTSGLSPSQNIIIRTAQGQPSPGDFPYWVDVRDVAKMHVEALSREESYGKRYIASGGRLSLKEIAKLAEETSPYWSPPTDLKEEDCCSVDAAEASTVFGIAQWLPPDRIAGDLLWQVENLWSVS